MALSYQKPRDLGFTTFSQASCAMAIWVELSLNSELCNPSRCGDPWSRKRNIDQYLGLMKVFFFLHFSWFFIIFHYSTKYLSQKMDENGIAQDGALECFRSVYLGTSEINCTGIESCKFCWHQAVFLLASGVCLRPWWEFNGIKPYVLCRLHAFFNMIAYSKTGKDRWDSTSFEAVWSCLWWHEVLRFQNPRSSAGSSN